MTHETEQQIENLAHDAKAVAFAQVRLVGEPGFKTDPSVRESVEQLALVLAGQLERLCELIDGRDDVEKLKQFGATGRGPAADAKAKQNAEAEAGEAAADAVVKPLDDAQARKEAADAAAHAGALAQMKEAAAAKKPPF